MARKFTFPNHATENENENFVKNSNNMAVYLLRFDFVSLKENWNCVKTQENFFWKIVFEIFILVFLAILTNYD